MIKGFGKVGRKLGIIKGYSARIPNGLLKQLEKHPSVKKISLDRPVVGFNGRTSVTVGARAVQDIMGYTGAGIGVAVIDSGITPWHDDLTYANGSGQRVAHFKDFVNGRTTAYDDWGHGTHVAGIVAGNGYDSSGTREGDRARRDDRRAQGASTATAPARSARSSPRSTTRSACEPSTTSASSTCRSARASTSPTTPIR